MNSLITITTLTPTRMGMGQAVDLIDQPVHRDAATNWPLLSGSGIKGVLLDDTRRPGIDQHVLDQVFGSVDRAGSLVATDLAALLFPIRSLYGVFAWVTCPLALSRAKDLADLARLTFPAQSFAPAFPNDQSPQAIHNGENALIASQNVVSLDELDLVSVPANLGSLATLLDTLTGLGVDQLKQRLCIVHDDIFTFLTEQGTELRTRTALEIGSKTAKDKSLRNEEYLPSYCVFAGYGVIPAPVRQEGTLQIGAQASIGAGLVRWKATRGAQ